MNPEDQLLFDCITQPTKVTSYMSEYTIWRTEEVIGGVEVELRSPCKHYYESVTVTPQELASYVYQTLSKRISTLEELL